MVVVPAGMGRLNRRALVARLQRLGTASRAGLAKSLGMSQPTAGKIADELITLGVLEELDDPGGNPRNGDAPAKLGRPGRMLRLDRTTPRFVALQLGVSETQLTALPLGADQEDRWTVTLPTPDSAEAWIEGLRRAAAQLRVSPCWGVLLSVPGIVDEAAGRILFSPNLHWTERMPLAERLRGVWQSPVVLVQEERALALGHQYLEPEAEDFLLTDFGEGVGGAVMIAGQLFANPLPISGELGHSPVLGNTRACGCGTIGCVETLVSTRGLLQSFAEAHRRVPPTWANLRQTIAKHGIEPWLAHSLDAAAIVIAGSLNVLGLRRVIITGCLGDLPPPVMDHLAQALRRGALWARFGEIDIQTAPRRRTAGLVAAGIDRLVLPMTARRTSAATPHSVSLLPRTQPTPAKPNSKRPCPLPHSVSSASWLSSESSPVPGTPAPNPSR